MARAVRHVGLQVHMFNQFENKPESVNLSQ